MYIIYLDSKKKKKEKKKEKKEKKKEIKIDMCWYKLIIDCNVVYSGLCAFSRNLQLYANGGP